MLVDTTLRHDQTVITLPLPVVLASGSPRRRELLSDLVASFTILVSDVDEDALTVSDPWKTAIELAKAKALAVAVREPEALVIGGDTVVALVVGDEPSYEQLSKPSDAQDAVRMLSKLSGRSHMVITGVALVWPGGTTSFVETTEVRFRQLSEREIRSYVETGEPLDKAGGYAIQGGAAGFVTAVNGSLTNVIGLPMERLGKEVESLLQDCGPRCARTPCGQTRP